MPESGLEFTLFQRGTLRPDQTYHTRYHRPSSIKSASSPRLLPLILSWDHRVIDGAAAAHFNVYLGQILGDFRRVLL